MGTNTVSHNTEGMRSWASNMEANAESYDMLVNRLYSLVDQFVGSSDFSGGLSSDFMDRVLSQKPEFQKFSTTFNECAKLINDRSRKIDSDEAQLKSRIAAANPLE